MKQVKLLLILAALAGVSVKATTVTFTGSQSPTASVTGSDTLTVARGYLFFNPNWTTVTVTQNGDGVAVDNPIGGFPNEIEGTWKEYVVFDFGATSTGNVQVNSIVLNFPNAASSPYFTYQWVSALPSGPTPAVPGGFTQVTGSTTLPTGDNTFTSISGSGRYLMLGAINGSYSTSNMYAVKSITYTSVPDGASTLALMGAAVATLGLAARRRRA